MDVKLWNFETFYVIVTFIGFYLQNSKVSKFHATFLYSPWFSFLTIPFSIHWLFQRIALLRDTPCDWASLIRSFNWYLCFNPSNTTFRGKRSTDCRRQRAMESRVTRKSNASVSTYRGKSLTYFPVSTASFFAMQQRSVSYSPHFKPIRKSYFHVYAKKSWKTNKKERNICMFQIFFVPLRRKRRKQTETWIAEHILYRFLTIR